VGEWDPLVAALVIFLLVRSEFGQSVGPTIGTADKRNSGLAKNGRTGHGFRLLPTLAVVVIFAAHLCVRSNALLPGLPANDGPPHGARDQKAQGYQDGSGKNKVGAPGDMGHKKEDIDKKAEEGHEKVKDAHEE